MSDQQTPIAPDGYDSSDDDKEETGPITRNELVKRLQEFSDATANRSDNPEYAHIDADGLLIRYINDPEIERLYKSITKWYS